MQSAGQSETNFNTEKELIKEFYSYVSKEYDSNKKINAFVITFNKSDATTLRSLTNSINLKNSGDISYALNNVVYRKESDYCDRGQAFNILFNDLPLSFDHDIYVYNLFNGKTTASNANYDNEDVIGRVSQEPHKTTGVKAYSEIMPVGWHYTDDWFHTKISSCITTNRDLFITLNNNPLDAMKTHFPTKLSSPRPVYEIILPTNWKKISLDKELDPNNKVDTDGDTLTDWEEVDTARLIWNEDGSFDIPIFEISVIVYLKRYQSDDYNFLFDDAKKEDPRYYLPILSDPTEKDSDGDGIVDPDEYTNLTTDSRYDIINPLKEDTIETLYPEFSSVNSNNPIYITVSENNIIINANIEFVGDTDVTPSGFYKTYKEAVIEGIKEHWEISFIGNNYDFYPGMAINVTVNINDDSKSKSFKIKIYDEEGGSYRKGNKWTQTKMKYILLNLNGKSFEEVKSVSAHEFGHNLGLKDAYGAAECNHGYAPTMIDFNNPQNNEIWYARNGTPHSSRGLIMWMEGYASSNDIEMVLQAFIDDEIQYFVPFGKKQHISKAIKSGDNVYVNKSDGTEKYYRFDYSKHEFSLIGDANAYKTWVETNYGITLDIGALNDAW